MIFSSNRITLVDTSVESVLRTGDDAESRYAIVGEEVRGQK